MYAEAPTIITDQCRWPSPRRSLRRRLNVDAMLGRHPCHHQRMNDKVSSALFGEEKKTAAREPAGESRLRCFDECFYMRLSRRSYCLLSTSPVCFGRAPRRAEVRGDDSERLSKDDVQLDVGLDCSGRRGWMPPRGYAASRQCPSAGLACANFAVSRSALVYTSTSGYSTRTCSKNARTLEISLGASDCN